jgi:tripartite-type tricarboxylate transporter receptor subunit TctC
LYTSRRCCGLVLSGLAAALLSASRVGAQTPAWPDRPVRVLVPVPPGAAPDLIARETAEHLARRFGQPFPVENRPGGDGLLAAEAMLAARPGEALLVTPAGALTLAPVLRIPPLAADPLDALTPIAALASDTFGLFTTPSLPVGSLTDLVAHTRAAGPATLNWFASVGPPTLVMRGFLREAGLSEMAFISYRGVPPALADLAAGRLHVLFVPLAGAAPLARDGRAKLMAVASSARAAAAPDTPTGTEAGFPSLLQEGLLGLFGWRGMPPGTAEMLASEAQSAMTALGDRMTARGQSARSERLQDLGGLLRSERARLAALARDFPQPPA